MLNISNFFKKLKNFDTLLFYSTLFIVILIGIILRLKVYFYNSCFWYDEASLGCNMPDLTFIKCFRPLTHNQVCPPLFLMASKILYSFTEKIPDISLCDMILRLFPLFCSIVSLFLFFYFSYKIFNNKYLTLVSTAIFSLNQSAINYAAEFKQYSTELLCSLILLIIFFKIDFNKISKQKLAFYSILFCLAPWFSLSSFFILFSGSLVILIDIIKAGVLDLKKVLILFLPAFLNLILFMFLYYTPVSAEVNTYMYYFWKTVLPSFFSFNNFIPMFYEKTTAFINLPFEEHFIIFILLSVTIFICYKNYKRIIILLAPIFLVILASFTSFYPYENRLILFLLPCFAIILSSIFLLFKENKISTAIISVIVLHFSIGKICMPPAAFISHLIYETGRDFYVQILKNDPKLEKCILKGGGGTTSVDDYYSIICLKKAGKK